MRLKEEQVQRLAESIVDHLVREGLGRLQGERGATVKVVREALAENLRQEAELERDAERLLEQTLRGLGSSAATIDRHKMLRMIKEKMAKEKKFVL